MIKRISKLLAIAFAITIIGLVLASCTTKKEDNNMNDNINEVSFESISQSEAKKIMDSESDYIILDVRTDEEYNEGHIKNAILIPDYEISQRAQNELKNKNQLILVYCRSGRRSKIASQALADLGYTNIKEFGGVNTWEYGLTK